jgi:hypothetical protein
MFHQHNLSFGQQAFGWQNVLPTEHALGFQAFDQNNAWSIEHVIRPKCNLSLQRFVNRNCHLANKHLNGTTFGHQISSFDRQALVNTMLCQQNMSFGCQAFDQHNVWSTELVIWPTGIG